MSNPLTLKLKKKYYRYKFKLNIAKNIIIEQPFNKGINLGAGKNWKQLNWIGIDKLDGNYLDDKSILPFKDKSIKYVYSSHFFEHINDECAINLFREIKRVLMDNGLLRIIVPNFELLHQNLINNDSTLMELSGFKGRTEWQKFGIENNNTNKILHWFASYSNYQEENIFENCPEDLYRGPPKLKKEEVLSAVKNLTTLEFGEWAISKIKKKYIKNGGHINTWTTKKFIDLLLDVGIKSKQKNYGDSESKVLGLFDYLNDRSQISLCHEGCVD